MGVTTASGTAIVAALGQEVSPIDFALVRGATISGTVTDAGTGQPIANKPVAAYDENNQFVSAALTGPSGAYYLSPLLAGTLLRQDGQRGCLPDTQLYSDIPCWRPMGCNLEGATAFTVSLDRVVEGVDFALARGGAIAGTVRDRVSGAPLQNVWVGVFDGGNSLVSVDMVARVWGLQHRRLGAGHLLPTRRAVVGLLHATLR